MDSSKKLLCICQICSCGRHYCVHKNPQTDTGKLTTPCKFTEYKEAYRKFSNYEPARPIVPNSAHRASTQPFDGSTSYKQVYVPHTVGPRPKREQAKYVRPEGQFEGKSSYQENYFEKSAEKMASAKPFYQPATGKPFDGTTVHQETYKSWELPTAHRLCPPPAVIRIPNGKFDHTSTFQDDYSGHKGHPGRDAINPPEPSLTVGSGKIADETTTRADYTRKNALPEPSAKPPQNVVQHKGPFEHRSTVQNTYKWPKGFPAESCRPENAVNMSKAPLDSETTHNMTYQRWQVAKRKSWKPSAGWSAPTDPFDHKTTFQQDYMNKSGLPAKSARPFYDRPIPGHFDGLTTHQDAFKPWETNARKSLKPPGNYVGPTSKFDGQSTFQSDFKGFSNARPNLCIPKEGGVSFAGSQEFSTMYRDTFHGKQPPVCPAKFLEAKLLGTNTNGFVYKHDLNGHQLFKAPGAQKSVKFLAV